jgi:hypothetical protein
MLDTLPSLPYTHLKSFISSLTPLCQSNPNLFGPHMNALLPFLRGLIMPSADSGPTPTVAKPFPGASSFIFPPGVSDTPIHDDSDAEEEEKELVRKAALEFMVSLSEAKPALAKRTEGWTAAMVRASLEGMGELPEDGLDAWLDADVGIFFRVFQEFAQSHSLLSPPRMRRMRVTLTYTSTPSTELPALLEVKQCFLQHSNTSRQCLPTMIGG